MKIKKFLCFSLASVMTFTATLSSSTSIFADDMQETEESQSFSSSFFNELVTLSDNIGDTNDYGISLLWRKNDHEGLIDSTAAIISENDRKIMKNCSAWADTCFKASDPTVVSVPGLHGPGNYVINLEFLWYFAIFLGKQSNPTSYDDMNKKIKAARDSAKEKIKGTTGYQTNQLQNLITNSGTLVKYNGAKMKNDTLLKSAKMKTRILGYAAHLAGDVFAHRTMVPSVSGFTLSDFDSDFSADVKAGIVAFRDIELYAKDGTEYNSKYIDNPSFYPNRYNDASANISDMLTTKAENFDYYAFLGPFSNGVKLENFKQYVKNSGLDVSRFSASEWAKIST